MPHNLLQYKKVALNTFFLSIMEATQIIMPFIALPLIIKTVGAENYGKTVFAHAICAYFTILVSFGLEYLGAKDIAVNRDNREKCGRILGTILIIKVFLCSVGFIIFSALILVWNKTSSDPLVYFFSFGACVSDIVFTHWLFQGLEKMFIITAIKSSSLFIYLGLLLLFLKKENQYPLIPLFQSSSLIFTSVLGLFYTIKHEKIKPVIPPFDEIIAYAKASFTFFLSRISSVFNNTIATTVIGITLGDYMVAVYDLAIRIVKAALIPVYMITQAVYPHNAKNRDIKFSIRVFIFTIISTIFGLSVLYFISPFIVNFLSDGKLMDSVILIRVLLFYILLATISVYLGTPTLVAWGYSKPFNHSVIIATLVLVCIYSIYYFLKISNVYYYCLALYLAQIIELSYRTFYCSKIIILSFKKGYSNS